jgi:hypothetical protein
MFFWGSQSIPFTHWHKLLPPTNNSTREKQCWGSVTFWYGSRCGSGSPDPYLWLTDPDADPGGPKTYGSYDSGSGFGTLVHLHHSSKIRSHTILAWWWKDLEPWFGSVLVTERIRMRIREAQNIRILIPNTVEQKILEDRVCTEHPGSSYPGPINSKRTLKFCKRV